MGSLTKACFRLHNLTLEYRGAPLTIAKRKRPTTKKKNVTTAASSSSELPTRAKLPGNFAELSQRFLDEKEFFGQVVPAFEKARGELVRIVAGDKRLSAKFASLHLVILDNRITEQKMYFWASHKHSAHSYLHDRHRGLKDYVGFSSPEISVLQGVHGNIYRALRSIFISELLAKAGPEDLAFYVERLLKKNYASVQKIKHAKYFLFRVVNYEFSAELFSMSAYRLNLVIPIAAKLDATHIPDEAWGNKKILLTLKTGLSGYKDFDVVVGRPNWCSHFTYMSFTSDLQFYKRLVSLDRSNLRAAVDHLDTNSPENLSELKRQLVNIPVSAGREFEHILERVLQECFRCSYKYIDLQSQVPNRGRRKVRDYIIRNHDSLSPFLKALEARGVELLLFDAKNYKKGLTSRDIAIFKDYIADNPGFGNFGVILSRNGVSRNCEETIFLDSKVRKLTILVLDQSDILMMLDKSERGEEGAEVLSEKYSEFLKQI
jgi:hypothetical protein